MRRTLGLRIVAALALLAAASPSHSPAGLLASAGSPRPQATCVFSNPGFSGKCVENADLAEGSTPTQACQAILQCLNDVDCLKTYCQATTIRNGWKLESAE
jgi:hypothetical protein